MVLTVIIGAVVGYGTTSKTARYSTTSVLYVGSRQLAQNPSELYAEPGLALIVSTYAEMIPTPVIAQRAVAATGVPRSVASVVSETKVTAVPNTTLLQVAVTDTDPLVAQRLANGMSNAFVTQINTYEPGLGGPGAVPTEPAYLFQDAPLPVQPLSTGLTRKLVLGIVFGFTVAVLLILLVDYLDVTVKSPEELEQRLDLPMLGTVPMRRSPPERVGVG